jgi:acyl-CoA thioesterase
MSKTVNLHKVIQGKSAPPACDITLGIKLSEANNGSSKGYWKVEDHLLNGKGVVMGGFVSAAADTMMAYAMVTLLKEDQTFASINLETTFHRPVFTGNVEIEAKVVKFGKTISYLTATFTQNGKHVASATSSVMAMPRNDS